MNMRSCCKFALLFIIWLLWLSPIFAVPSYVEFTPAEQAFIKDHESIRIGIDPKFVPFEFLSANGQYTGIASDFLKLISEMSGLRFVNDPSLNWVQSVQRARDRELDMLPTVGFTEARAQYMTYTDAYLHFQRAIVIKKSNASLKTFSDLQGRQVAVQKDSSHEGFLSAYPAISMRFYNTVEEALLAVQNGEEVAFIGNEATSAYLARILGLTELQFIPISEGGVQSLYMAVRNDWPLLVSILDKCLRAIPDVEFASILNKWIQYENRIDYTWVIRMLIPVAVVMLLIVGISFFWIVRLRRAVKEKDLAKEAAQQADMEKSRFMARISHEIRTPLNGVKGMEHLLEKTELNTVQSRYVMTMKSAIQTMQTIINDILEYSRMDEGRITLEHIPFTIDEVLQNCIAIDSWLVHQKGLEFRLLQSDNVPQYLIGDPTRLSQILTNLLHNAVKFTSEGFIELIVSASALTTDQTMLTLTVRDSGIGMTEQQKTGLFTPFAQANETIHRKYGGSGLGLSIVKGFVDFMGGTLSVDSEMGKGSTFKVELPITLDKKGLEEDVQRKKSVDFSSRKVLLVLKEGLLLDHLESLLNGYQITYDSVSSLKLACSIIQNVQNYDLVILEMEKPTTLSTECELAMQNLSSARPKMLCLVHNEGIMSEGKDSAPPYFDLVLPLPIIRSVMFNALLQLFEPSQKDFQRPSTNKAEKRTDLALQVLVIEDNPTNQLIAKEFLEQVGCSVLVAGNGKIGYEMFVDKEDTIDVVLMDLHMDVMDGYESTKLIRTRNANVPILITSADLMDSVRQACTAIGGTDLIGKPYEADFLVEKVFTNAIAYRTLKRNNASVDFKLGVRQIGGDRKLYSLVLSSFVTELEQTLPKLRAALDAGDDQMTGELAHLLKGSCQAIGAGEAQKLCSKIQLHYLGSQKQNDPMKLVGDLFEELEQVKKQSLEYQNANT